MILDILDIVIDFLKIRDVLKIINLNKKTKIYLNKKYFWENLIRRDLNKNIIFRLSKINKSTNKYYKEKILYETVLEGIVNSLIIHRYSYRIIFRKNYNIDKTFEKEWYDYDLFCILTLHYQKLLMFEKKNKYSTTKKLLKYFSYGYDNSLKKNKINLKNFDYLVNNYYDTGRFNIVYEYYLKDNNFEKIYQLFLKKKVPNNNYSFGTYKNGYYEKWNITTWNDILVNLNELAKTLNSELIGSFKVIKDENNSKIFFIFGSDFKYNFFL